MPTEWEAPTAEQVALYLPTRARDKNGNIVRNDDGQRTFDENTVPTLEEVTYAISECVAYVQSDIGETFCDKEGATSFPEKATRLCAMFTAMTLELGYYPEQVQKGQSPYTELKKVYDERRKYLRSEIEEVCGDVPGDDGSSDGTGSKKPNYNFDAPTVSLGRGTIW